MTLQRALAYSLLVHLVLASLLVAIPVRDGTPGRAASLSAALVKTSAPFTESQPALRTPSQPVDKIPSTTKSPAVQRAPEAPPARPAPPAQATAAASGSESRQPVDQSAPEAARELVSAEGLRQYRLSLAREARRHRQYPAVARARGWEGTVELRVDVTAGARPAVGLVRSSGYEVLDAEALEMMGRAVIAAVLPSSLHGQNFSVPVPVRFALDD